MKFTFWFSECFCGFYIFDIIDAITLLRIFRIILFFSDIPLQNEWAGHNDYEALMSNFAHNLYIGRLIRDWMFFCIRAFTVLYEWIVVLL